MTEVVVTQARHDMAYAKSIVEAVEQGCTYEDRCIAVSNLLARHRTLTPIQAAGPVLLEALKRVLDRGYVSKHIGEEHDDHIMIVAAITQAEGRRHER